MISIITPWHNCPELIPDYEAAVNGAQVIAIDNASDPETSEKLRAMVTRLGHDSVFIRNDENAKFAHANNQGLNAASGEIVVFLNSDVRAHGDWLSIVGACKRGSLYSPSAGIRYVDGIPIYYLEGYCLFGWKEDFIRIGGWNDTDFPGLYWEDNEICWRASRAGLGMKQVALPLEHLSNYTSKRTPGAYDASAANQAVFDGIVREARRHAL
ncbi:MAG: glycosyltransferase [Veillonellaceae bacterium]|nr:glycosyltransferase [Veillonellaceae bacterium]